MCPIVSQESAPHHARLFREWRIREWGMESEMRNDENVLTPVPPELLYLRNGKLLGGLAFTRFKEPNGNRIALWINSVIVAAEHRGKGIGGELVRRAEREAMLWNEPDLFVYTDTPQLYTTNGWVVLSKQDGYSALKASPFSANI